MKSILYIQILILFSLSYASHAEVEFITQIPFTNRIETDTLRDPNHFYYLADVPLKKIGEMILADSIEPSDNFLTFTLMDTISGCKMNDLGFYLRVFEKIINHADGALAEVVGDYTWRFIKNRPVEFISHIDTLNDEQIMKWADHTLDEMYFAYPENELKMECQKLVKKLKKINPAKSVTTFGNELVKRAEEVTKEQ